MKYLPQTFLLASSLAFVSCASFNQPFESSGEYNPLDPAGSPRTTVASKPTQAAPQSPSHKPGTFLSATTPQTVFYKKFPSGSDQPSKVIDLYTEVKVISTKGTYTKAEIVGTGEVGYIPTIMLGEKRSPNEIPVIPGGSYADSSSTPPPLPDPESLGVPTSMPSILPEGVPEELPPIAPPLPDPALSQDVPFVAPEAPAQGIVPPDVTTPQIGSPEVAIPEISTPEIVIPKEVNPLLPPE